jgi:hypothetical protein
VRAAADTTGQNRVDSVATIDRLSACRIGVAPFASKLCSYKAHRIAAFLAGAELAREEASPVTAKSEPAKRLPNTAHNSLA